MKNGRPEAGDGRQEIGRGKQKMGDRKRENGSRKNKRIISRQILYLLAICVVIGSAYGFYVQHAKSPRHSAQPKGIVVENATVGVAAKGMSSAAFFKIVNESDQPDTLYGVRASFAEMAQLHESFKKDGMVGMRPVKFLVIPAKSSVVFKHGGYHVMLMEVKENLTAGKKVRLELLFKTAGIVTVIAVVKH